MTSPRRQIGQLLLLTIISIALAAPATAHHGWSHYENAKKLELTGTIREAGYSNPHGFARLQVEGKKGKLWYIVLAPPSRMETRGLTRQMLEKGTTATVVGYRHREKSDELRAERITIAGKTIELR